jgi:hypothetical protein
VTDRQRALGALACLFLAIAYAVAVGWRARSWEDRTATCRCSYPAHVWVRIEPDGRSTCRCVYPNEAGGGPRVEV